jgi:hypothetical protein
MLIIYVLLCNDRIVLEIETDSRGVSFKHEKIFYLGLANKLRGMVTLPMCWRIVRHEQDAHAVIAQKPWFRWVI